MKQRLGSLLIGVCTLLLYGNGVQAGRNQNTAAEAPPRSDAALLIFLDQEGQAQVFPISVVDGKTVRKVFADFQQQIRGTAREHSVWLKRPDPKGGDPLIIPVTCSDGEGVWVPESDYAIEPGDWLYVDRRLPVEESHYAKVWAPLERLFGWPICGDGRVWTRITAFFARWCGDD